MIQSTVRREADEFARVLDGPVSTEVADRYAELTRAVTLLRERPRPTPRPDFVLDLRERLMVAAETDLVPATPETGSARTSASRKGHRRLATIAAATVFVGGTAGMAAAAQGTLPGDSLYPIKRGLENVQLHLNTSDTARGHDLLSQAATRLQEAQDLLAEPRTPARDQLIDEALRAAATSANSGSDLLFTHYQQTQSASDIADVRKFANAQMGILGSLAGQHGLGGIHLRQVGDALAAIDQQAQVLCSACSDLPDAAVPDDVLTLSSAKTTLGQLVSVPTIRAEKMEKLAQRAQQVAQHTGAAASTQGTDHADNAAGSSASSTSGDTQTKSKPVHDLINGLTSTSKSSLPGQIGTTLNGVTSGLNGVVDDTLGLVDGLLGAKK